MPIDTKVTTTKRTTAVAKKRADLKNSATKRAAAKSAATKVAGPKIKSDARSRRTSSSAVVRKRAAMVLRSSDVQARRASSRVVTVVEPAIKEGQPVRLVANGKTVTLPPSFAAALYQTAREQAVGHRVTVSFPDSVDELTPNQVAAELGISRPLLVKLLDDGTIPSRQLPGSRHRKVARVDLDAYQEKKSTRRRLIADAMNQVATAGEYLPR
jgi:excisionase family DNA binding protein